MFRVKYFLEGLVPNQRNKHFMVLDEIFDNWITTHYTIHYLNY